MLRSPDFASRAPTPTPRQREASGRVEGEGSLYKGSKKGLQRGSSRFSTRYIRLMECPVVIVLDQSSK